MNSKYAKIRNLIKYYDSEFLSDDDFVYELNKFLEDNFKKDYEDNFSNGFKLKDLDKFEYKLKGFDSLESSLNHLCYIGVLSYNEKSKKYNFVY